MKLLIAAAVIAALSGCAVAPNGQVYADPVAVGVTAGVVGLVVGASLAQPHYYAPPQRVYYGPPAYYRHQPRGYVGGGFYYRQPRY